MISPGPCICAKADFFRGVHQPGDSYMIALYTEQASLNTFVREYTTDGECSGKGYARGGQELRGYTVEEDGAVGIMGWTVDPTWKNATIAARGALIYNKSRNNRAIAVVDFGEIVRSTNGNFRVPMPPVTAADALIYMA